MATEWRIVCMVCPNKNARFKVGALSALFEYRMRLLQIKPSALIGTPCIKHVAMTTYNVSYSSDKKKYTSLFYLGFYPLFSELCNKGFQTIKNL